MAEAIPIPPADDDMNVWLTMLFGFGQPVMTVQSSEDMAAAEAQGDEMLTPYKHHLKNCHYKKGRTEKYPYVSRDQQRCDSLVLRPLRWHETKAHQS